MTAADQFQTAIEKLAEDTANAARRIANRRNITKADRAVRLAALLNTANAHATTLAEGFTNRQVETLTGRPVPAKGLLPVDDSERLLKATRTVMEDRDPLERIERLARSEPLSTAQTTVTNAMEGRKPARGFFGWTRQLNAGACELCRHWARGGRVWPADHRMPRHPNCACVQQITQQANKPKPVRKRKK